MPDKVHAHAPADPEATAHPLSAGQLKQDAAAGRDRGGAGLHGGSHAGTQTGEQGGTHLPASEDDASGADDAAGDQESVVARGLTRLPPG